jgi:hypothetical protein
VPAQQNFTPEKPAFSKKAGFFSQKPDFFKKPGFSVTVKTRIGLGVCR